VSGRERIKRLYTTEDPLNRKAGNEEAVVSAVLSGLGLGNDCTGDSARYNRGFLESGKQEPRKWDFRGRRKSREGSGE